jgi:hypothetical protein
VADRPAACWASRCAVLQGNTWYVEVDDQTMTNTLGVDMTRDVVTCEVPFGSVLFLNNLIPHRSLENLSDNIRWSFDLRWLRPDEPNGFYGLKPSLLMRTAQNPAHRPDWDGWNAVSRDQAQTKAVEQMTQSEACQRPALHSSDPYEKQRSDCRVLCFVCCAVLCNSLMVTCSTRPYRVRAPPRGARATPCCRSGSVN